MSRRPLANQAKASFQRGQFVQYRATVSFHVGEHEIKIAEDDVVEFDGVMLRVGGEELSARGCRGAVRSEWLVPISDTTTEYKPRQDIVEMKPADTTKTGRSDTNTQPIQSSDVVVQSEDRVVRRQVGNPATPQMGEVREKKARVQAQATAEGTEGTVSVSVGRINVPNKFQSSLENSTSASSEQSRLGTMEAGEKVAFTGSKLSDVLPEAASSEEHYAGVDNKEVVQQTAEARRQQRLQQVAAMEGAKHLPENGAVALENDQDIALVETNTPAKQSQGSLESEEENPESEIVRTSVGVDWDLGQHWMTRVKTAKDRFGSSRDILLAIAEVETEAVSSRIEEFVEENFD